MHRFYFISKLFSFCSCYSLYLIYSDEFSNQCTVKHCTLFCNVLWHGKYMYSVDIGVPVSCWNESIWPQWHHMSFTSMFLKGKRSTKTFHDLECVKFMELTSLPKAGSLLEHPLWLLHVVTLMMQLELSAFIETSGTGRQCKWEHVYGYMPHNANPILTFCGVMSFTKLLTLISEMSTSCWYWVGCADRLSVQTWLK